MIDDDDRDELAAHLADDGTISAEESAMTATLRIKVVCHVCRGSGLIYGPSVRDEWGKSLGFREERNCEACEGAGHRMETVELDEQALEALRAALLQFGSMA